MADGQISLVQFYRKRANDEQRFYLKLMFDASDDERRLMATRSFGMSTQGAPDTIKGKVDRDSELERIRGKIGAYLLKLDELGLGGMPAIKNSMAHYSQYANGEIETYPLQKKSRRN